MNFMTEDILLLRKLLLDETVDLYALHNHYRLSPAQIARSVAKFTEKEWIELLSGMQVRLTSEGRKWCTENAVKILAKKREKYWKQIPEDMCQAQLQPNTLYKPNLGKMNKRTKVRHADSDLFYLIN